MCVCWSERSGISIATITIQKLNFRDIHYALILFPFFCFTVDTITVNVFHLQRNEYKTQIEMHTSENLISLTSDHLKIQLFTEETLRPRLGFPTLVKCSPLMEKCQNNIDLRCALGLQVCDL